MQNLPSRELKANVVGLVGAATLGTVMLSPAMTLYGNFGPAFSSAGMASPLVFLWALLATIPTAVSYALVSREHPSSGSAYTWTREAISPRAGVWAGWIVFAYYLTNFIIQPLCFGLFFNDLLAALGLGSGFATFALGTVLCLLISAGIVYRGITPSTKGALGFLLFEVAVVTGLCLTITVFKPNAGTQLSTAGFHLAASSGGTPGLFQALVFSMLAFCGFDVISTLAEEAKMARKLVPQAMLLSLLLYGAFIIAGVWALTYAASPERIRALSDNGGMPITALARDFWGRGSIFIVLTGISASLGIAIATAVGSSRILFAMGRDGHAPRGFARVHGRYQVPWQAIHLVFALGLAAPLLVSALSTPYTAYIWFCTSTTFFAMMTYLLVNLANLVLNRRKVFSGARGFLLHGLLPAVGIGVDGYILVRTFFIELWGQGWATGKSIVLFAIGTAVLAAVAALRARSPSPLGPQSSRRTMPVFESTHNIGA